MPAARRAGYGTAAQRVQVVERLVWPRLYGTALGLGFRPRLCAQRCRDFSDGAYRRPLPCGNTQASSRVLT